MLCALTVRTLKPGTFDEFRHTFMRHENLDDPAAGYVRFNMIRNAENPDEVICFGFFDGSVDELRRTAAEQGYAEQLEAIAPLVESVGADGLYEIVEDHAFRDAVAEEPTEAVSARYGWLSQDERKRVEAKPEEDRHDR